MVSVIYAPLYDLAPGLDESLAAGACFHFAYVDGFIVEDSWCRK
jgi:hypothetical protein